MMVRTLVPAAVLLALAPAGCATPESRLESALREAGLPPRLSGCMAERMADELSVSQLLALRSLGSLSDAPVDELSTREFLRRVRALRDPEILGITTAALGRCSIGL